MMLQGQHIIEVHIAVSVVKAIGTPEDIALAGARQRETEWLQQEALPPLAASEKVAVAGMDDFFEAYGSGGEIEALRALLEVHRLPLLPPADWTSASARPAAKP